MLAKRWQRTRRNEVHRVVSVLAAQEAKAEGGRTDSPVVPGNTDRIELDIWELARFRAMFVRLDTGRRDYLTLEEFLHLPSVLHSEIRMQGVGVGGARCGVWCKRMSHKRWKPLGRVVVQPWFDLVVLALIVLNIVSMAVWSPRWGEVGVRLYGVACSALCGFGGLFAEMKCTARFVRPLPLFPPPPPYHIRTCAMIRMPRSFWM